MTIDPHDFGPFPPVHPRHEAVYLAGIELDRAFLEIRQKHHLTFAETFWLLSDRLHREAAYCVRAKREADEKAKDDAR
jgi:hypothetical protein